MAAVGHGGAAVIAWLSDSTAVGRGQGGSEVREECSRRHAVTANSSWRWAGLKRNRPSLPGWMMEESEGAGSDVVDDVDWIRGYAIYAPAWPHFGVTSPTLILCLCEKS